MLAPGDCRARLEIERTPQCGSDGSFLDRLRQPVTDSGYGQDALAVDLAQGFAQLRHRVGQHVLDGYPTRPNLVEEFLSGDHLARMSQ